MHVIYRQQEWHFDKPMKAIQLLKNLHLLPEAVLVIQNGKLVPEDQVLNAGDEIKIVAAISGG